VATDIHFRLNKSVSDAGRQAACSTSFISRAMIC